MKKFRVICQTLFIMNTIFLKLMASTLPVPVPVSTTEENQRDPEFACGGPENYVLYSTVTERSSATVVAARVLPDGSFPRVEGELVTTVIAENIISKSPVSGIGNGAEWGQNSYGPAIFFTDPQGVFYRSIEALDSYQVQVGPKVLVQAPGYFLPLGSNIPSQNRFHVILGGLIDNDTEGVFLTSQMDSGSFDEPQLLSDILVNTGSARWVPDSEFYTFGRKDANNITQAWIRNIGGTLSTQVSQGKNDTSEQWAIPYPDLGNDVYIFLHLTSVSNGKKIMEIYKLMVKSNKIVSEPIRAIEIEGSNQVIRSPEPFLFDGKPHVSFVTVDRRERSSVPKATLWYANLMAGPPVPLTPIENRLHLKDPEFCVIQQEGGGQKGFIFYSQFENGNSKQRITYRVAIQAL